MKRLLLCLLTGLILLPAFTATAADIYVSTQGSDTNPGTKEQPLATLNMALRKARELRRLNDPSIKNGINIILEPGIYRLAEPVLIRPEDSGTVPSPTIIRSGGFEKTILSGGIPITNWSRAGKIENLPAKAQGNTWVADVPLTGNQPTNFRQLWVNDKKAIRAKDNNGIAMSRILSWNKRTEQCWIPTPAIDGFKNITGAEMLIHQWWEIANLRIKKMEVHGDSTLLSFHQPESRVQSEHPWPAPWISKETGNSAFYLTNALQFLDEPGEWYLDIAGQKLYYWPRTGEDLSKDTVIAPVLETLVKVQGTIDHPVSNIEFNGISFHHTGWLRPSQYGHVPHQAGMYMVDAYKLKTSGTPDKKTLENQAWVGRPAAAVEFNYTHHSIIKGCSFRHIASTALDQHKGAQSNTIEGNLFRDIGGSAILAGVYSDEATEVHLPYNPKDAREICDKLNISNNLITDAANEDWGCVGIGAGYVKNIHIHHNEICDVSYTGISMGWGWTKTPNAMSNNRIIANKIHHYGKHMYDVAAIYTLSAQKNSLIADNYIDSIYKAPYAHIPSHWFYLYTDEGSSFITVRNNWTPSEKYLQNANGPGNTWTNNGPQVNETIKQSAGIQYSHRHLANESQTDPRYAINREIPVIIELVSRDGQSIALPQLKEILEKSKVPVTSLYQWQNHTIIFEKVPDVFVLKDRIRKAFPGVEIRTYDDLFYEFNRQRCGDKKTAKQWDHILLTADLVADTTLQKEYLDHHATQFEKWPELSKGFCNAGFQQLLLFRNGRQLMLVISIPKGESLDKLNPKTTENNPRVDEWNNLMKKYQQGIEGTKPGETWVFLNPVK